MELREGSAGRSLAWEVRWFARSGESTIGGERGTLPFAAPDTCPDVRVLVLHGEHDHPWREVPGRRLELRPGLRMEIVAPDDVEHLAASRFVRSPGAAAVPSGPDAAEWMRRWRERQERERRRREECQARVRVADRGGRWRLSVTSLGGTEWAAVERSLPRDRHPFAYALYPVSLPPDGALMVLQVGVTAALVTGPSWSTPLPSLAKPSSVNRGFRETTEFKISGTMRILRR